MGKVRLVMVANHDRGCRGITMLEVDKLSKEEVHGQILKQVKNKLRFKATRLFLLDTGKEMLLENYDEWLQSTLNVVASKGETFQGKPHSSARPCKVLGMPSISLPETPITKVSILAEATWLEDSSILQLKNTVRDLPGMRIAIGMPDLHAGRRYPIGAVFGTQDVIYPPLVGGDIGCGMRLVQTSVPAHAVSPKQLDRWEKSLEEQMEVPSPAESATNALASSTTTFSRHGVDLDAFQKSLGTIGGGNHFAEMQVVAKIHNTALFEQYRLSKDNLFVLVHSGSRGLGKTILERHLELHGEQGLHVDSPEGKAYLELHDATIKWARQNRLQIAERFVRAISPIHTDTRCVTDIWHNTVSKEPSGGNKPEELWFHRKGAASSREDLVIIPGSRGALSYLVKPKAPSLTSGFSLAHGAGRKWKRSKAKEMGKARYPRATDLKTTSLDSRVICRNKDLLYEEAPEAYKEITDVVQDLLQHDLIEIVAEMRPVLTFKTSKP
mmetsp:Transcript_7570/g.13218  ORF Transcript_7570/g.13218 Transcript_7570/m.13218 type:complete len:497 (-) Transcript_7570:67-1557(-)